MSSSSNKRSYFLIDYRTNCRSVKALEAFGYSIMFTAKLNSVHESISGHADVQICSVGSKYICEPTVYDYYKAYIKPEYLCYGHTSLKSKYPADIAYNVCVIGKYAFHNFKYTDTVILNELNLNGFKLINVNQGYSKCNICVVSENALITSDEGIYKNALLNNIDALKINYGNINLHGFKYGFIGGAAGLIEKNILAVNGSLKKHPDYNNIKSFCLNYGVDLVELDTEIAEDIGSIIKISFNSVK